MMIARLGGVARTVARRGFHSSPAVFAEEATDAATQVTLNLTTPHAAIHEGVKVDMVIIPGVAGEYGVTAGHTPVVSELKPGVVQIFHDRNEEPEKYFLAAGFAATHPNSVTDLMAVEAVPLDDIDGDAARKGLGEFKAAMDKAEAGSVERAEAQIGFEVHSAMCIALGLPTN